MFINDHETIIDCLHYEPIAKTLALLVRESGDTPVTIGIHGDWGAGKSSVLAMAQKQFEGDEGILCIRFNGWRFQGFEDAKASLIESIITELRDKRSAFDKVAETATDLLKRVDKLKAAKIVLRGGVSFLTGVPHPGMLGDIASIASTFIGVTAKGNEGEGESPEGESLTEGLLKPAEARRMPEEMNDFDQAFAKLIEQAKLKKLVVLIDDLDRCLPDTAIETLEAIRLFVFAPKTAFVVAADEAMIHYCVRKHFPDLPSGPVSYAQNYLEKLIQIPFRIPALGPVETQIYTTLLLAEAEAPDGMNDESFKELLAKAKEMMVMPWKGEILDAQAIQTALGPKAHRLCETMIIGPQIYRILAEGTSGNPRQIKRFISALLLRRAIAVERGFGREIKLPMLAKLMLAERFNDPFFEQLTRAVSQAVDGKPSTLVSIEAEKAEGEHSTDAKAAEWEKNPWVVSWAKLEPKLGNEDLRPYFFLTRDKRAILPGLDGKSHLNELLEALLGNEIAVRSKEEALKALTQSDAQALVRAITTRIFEAGDFNAPKGTSGLQAIARSQPFSRPVILQFCESLDPTQIGPWAVPFLNSLSSYPDSKVKADEICARWEKDGSPRLKAALTAFKQPTKSK